MKKWILKTKYQTGGTIERNEGEYIQVPTRASKFLKRNANKAELKTAPVEWLAGKVTGMDSWEDLGEWLEEQPTNPSVTQKIGNAARGAWNVAQALPMPSIGIIKTGAKALKVARDFGDDVVKQGSKLFLRPGSVKQEVAEEVLNPIINKKTIKKKTPARSDFGYLHQYQTGGKIAKTKEDYELGILKGIDTFKFNKPGFQQMTMNTPRGTVPFPIQYKGYTKGRLTDKGVARPGQNFRVYGDTIIEKPIF